MCFVDCNLTAVGGDKNWACMKAGISDWKYFAFVSFESWSGCDWAMQVALFCSWLGTRVIVVFVACLSTFCGSRLQTVCAELQAISFQVYYAPSPSITYGDTRCSVRVSGRQFNGGPHKLLLPDVASFSSLQRGHFSKLFFFRSFLFPFFSLDSCLYFSRRAHLTTVRCVRLNCGWVCQTGVLNHGNV